MKRPQVNWKKYIDDLEDFNINSRYWLIKSNHPKMSVNRCAFYALKSFYTAKQINAIRYRIVGEFL